MACSKPPIQHLRASTLFRNPLPKQIEETDVLQIALFQHQLCRLCLQDNLCLSQTPQRATTLLSSRKLIKFQIRCTREHASYVLFETLRFLKANNRYFRKTRNWLVASDLISSDAKYLFISIPRDDGPPRLHSEFLNPPFLVVAQSIVERVVSICNFCELSMTRHILERVALDKTGNFNEGCSSAVTYGKHTDIMVSDKAERMQEKVMRFYSALKSRVIVEEEVEEEKFDSDSE
ncbi:hypothetical protein BDR26DRAFT_914898 [Obelidium mucronatum]|nr:hypothetical protein BDR26DRAFT_914898 [Obelidium mucronatum]